MKAKFLVVPALAALAVTGVTIATLPGADRDRGKVDIAVPAAGKQVPVAKAYVGDVKNPATWKLPVEAYMASSSETRLVASASDASMKECMASAGVPNWTPPPVLPQVGGKTLTDWRYGTHDLALAQKFGYHPDPAEQERYYAVLPDPASLGTDAAALGRCTSQTQSALGGVQESPVAEEIKAKSYKEAERSAPVQAVFAQWSQCMKEEGFAYKNPMDANDDPRFAVHEITDEEKKTAVADVKCRDQYSVEKVWFDAEVAIQLEEIPKKITKLNQQKATIASITQKAKASAGETK